MDGAQSLGQDRNEGNKVDGGASGEHAVNGSGSVQEERSTQEDAMDTAQDGHEAAHPGTVEERSGVEEPADVVDDGGEDEVMY